MAIFADDHRYMARALQLARQGLYTTDPNPNVGCVLVNSTGDIVGEGFHQRAGELHAEPLAIADAGDRARGTTAYVTLEPCNHHGRTPPCAEALINAGITRVVAATQDPNPTVSGRGYEKLRAAGIQVDTGVMEADALELNRGYTQRMRHGRPWVRVKLAVSVDGRTALANGESQWITGEAARADVHSWRARSSVVMSGIGTVLADNPALDARVHETVVQPKRLIVDSRLRTPVDAKLLKHQGDVLLVYTHDQEQHAQALQGAGADLLRLEPNAAGRVPLGTLLDVLGEQSVNEVLVESGPALSGALLAAHLVNELIVYQAPVILGGDARGMFELPSLLSMADRYHLELTEVRHVGSDLRMLYRCGEGVN